MIVSVDTFKLHVNTSLHDQVLRDKLLALESLIRNYTNNNFQQRNMRTCIHPTAKGTLIQEPWVKPGDTIQISQSQFNDGLYEVNDMGKIYTLYDEPTAVATKVVYPLDVQIGVINMLKWDIENRDKVGIASETISRHSVSYFNMDEGNTKVGYPSALVSFLKPYIKARF